MLPTGPQRINPHTPVLGHRKLRPRLPVQPSQNATHMPPGGNQRASMERPGATALPNLNPEPPNVGPARSTPNATKVQVRLMLHLDPALRLTEGQPFVLMFTPPDEPFTTSVQLLFAAHVARACAWM